MQESHPQYGLNRTAFNIISTQVWAIQIIWGWNKNLIPIFLNHSNYGSLSSWTGARNSLVCLRAGEGIPLSTAVVLRRPPLSIIALVIACVVQIMSSM